MIRLLFILIVASLPLVLEAQKKDSLNLICPLNEAVEPPAEKQPYSLGVEELKITLKSAADTNVKAVTAGIVTNVMRDEDGSWTVMCNSKDYYFLYSGITKAQVQKGQHLQRGERLGYLAPNAKLDFQLYDFETPLDPKKYMKCFK